MTEHEASPDRGATAEGTPDMVTIVVDSEMCIGGGQCEMLEPDVFEVDDDTSIAGVVGTASFTPERADELIDRCPSGALKFADSPVAEESP